MNIKSCKAKGRALCAFVRAKLLEWAPDLNPQDIEITTSSVTGRDIKLYGEARDTYPFAIECKKQEAVNVWKSYDQACSHAMVNEIPLLVINRNRSKVLVVIEIDDFMGLIR